VKKHPPKLAFTHETIKALERNLEPQRLAQILGGTVRSRAAVAPNLACGFTN
jgi:hypothetical protein